MSEFYFAWVESTDTTFGSEHHRADEDVVTFDIQHAEGDFASLDITVRNPRVGLLAPGRKVWAWFAIDRGGVVPLFFGRLVGLPTDLDQDTVRLSFIARPADFQAQKVALADTLKVRPYWAPEWFSQETRDDPDNVLESRPQLWHIDRTTLEVTASNILNGEDGTVALGEGDVFHDSVQVSYSSAPARRVEVVATVAWDQNATGVLNLSRMMDSGGGWGELLTYTGEQLEKDWPKPGAGIGRGWSVENSSLTRRDPLTSAEWGYYTVHLNHATFTKPGLQSTFSYMEHYWQLHVPPFATERNFFGIDIPAHALRVPRGRYYPVFTIRYEASRKKNETLTFTLEADTQAIVTEPGDEETLKLALSTSEIAAPIDPGGAMPIGDPSARVFFASDRGEQSIEYVIAVARAKLLARARAVNIAVEIPLSVALAAGLSCRKNVALTDSRLPGGTASGKITRYSMSGDGDSGDFGCTITFACTVGKGATVSGADGTPVYVADGYVDAGYQQYAGAVLMPIAGEVTYESVNGMPPVDDGVDFRKMSIANNVLNFTRSGSAAEQEAVMGTDPFRPNLGEWSAFYDVKRGPINVTPSEVMDRLNTVPTKYSLLLRPLDGGPFETPIALTVSDLMVPKTIDLEAESSS